MTVAICIVALIYLFWDGVVATMQSWQAEQYSHGPLIPLVAVFLFLQRFPRLIELELSGRWLGSVLVALSLGGWVLGELGAAYSILQYALLPVLYGLVIAVLGWPRTKCVWAALLYLVFTMPLPHVFNANLSLQMQLWSSSLGVAVIRWFDISVFLEGNVIDLGVYKLQVVEACSGLSYLFPLTSFSFLLAYLFRAPVWQRCIIFVSAAPITILMNSLRIGVIGVLVEHYGIAMADGFLHWFEGWLIFIGCVAFLLIEMKLFTVFFKGSYGSKVLSDLSDLNPDDDPNRKAGFIGALDLSWPSFDVLRKSSRELMQRSLPLYLCMALLLVSIPASLAFQTRVAVVQQRQEFVAFPLFHGGWVGRQSSLGAEVLDSLKLTDYFIADYRESAEGTPVNLYVAFYASQGKEASIHSPRFCIPGGGWEIVSIEERQFPEFGAGAELRVNRVIIQKGNVRQVVYYWFQQRGRIITNEYLAKWYISWDALTRNRTDGGLVRVMVPVTELGGLGGADAELLHFIGDFYPLVSQYIPD